MEQPLCADLATVAICVVTDSLLYFRRMFGGVDHCLLAS